MSYRSVFLILAGFITISVALGIVIFFMAVSATLITQGWPDIILGSTLTDWLTAIGTIGATLGAVWVSVSSKKEALRLKRVDSMLYAYSLLEKIHFVEDALDRSSKYKTTPMRESFQDIDEANTQIASMEYERLKVVMPDVSRKVLEIKKIMSSETERLRTLTKSIHMLHSIQFSPGKKRKLKKLLDEIKKQIETAEY